MNPRTKHRERLALPAYWPLMVVLFASCGPSRKDTWSYPSNQAQMPIVLIVLDALHADHVSHLGYQRETTPNIDALALDSTSFANTFAATPYTLASIPTILTGRHPDRHGLTQPGSELPASEETLAEILVCAGYKTHAVIGNLQGSSLHALDQGFEVYRELFRGETGANAGPASRTVHIPSAPEYLPVLKTWTNSADERPPFYYLHLLEPHMPYDPPAAYRERFMDPAYSGPFEDGATGGEAERSVILAKHRGRAEHRQAARDLYDAHLAFVDHHVGQILQYLKDIGLYERALVILTSDHGEALWQHGRWGHSTQVYDEMLHVPLIVKWPADLGFRSGLNGELVSSMDIVPTICDLLGVVPPNSLMQGVSLVPALATPAAFSQSNRSRRLISRTNHEVPILSLRGADYKTILTRNPSTQEVERIESYALDPDPLELRDLGAEGRALPDAELLLEWARSAYQTAPLTHSRLTDVERQHLGDLGYADD